MNRNKLSKEITEQIEELSEIGSALFDEENYGEAIAVWQNALQLIPKPSNAYFESQWLETSIGDAYYMLQDDDKALGYFLKAKSNIDANAYENPFLMLRLGQMYFESDLFYKAKEYLLSAYMMEGVEIFEQEDEKYFQFLKNNVALL